MKLFITLSSLLLASLLAFSDGRSHYRDSRYGPHHFQQSIVNGVSAQAGEAPSQVYLWQSIGNGYIEVCGGSLISADKVLTAAHCVDPAKGTVTVRYGTLNRNESPNSDVNSVKVVRHPKYIVAGKTDVTYDIAVVTLESDIEEDENIQYATLRTTALKIGDPLTVFGWGLTSGGGSMSDQLLKTSLKVTGIEPRRIMCKGVNTIICQGDSGGVMLDSNGHQCGVTSACQVGCPPGGLNVYTNVSAFVDWVQQQ